MTAVDNDLAWKTHPDRPCKDSNLWTSDEKADGREAARLCRVKACPVLWKCGQWALDNGERHHVWGGKNFNTKEMHRIVAEHVARRTEEALERQLKELHGRGLSDGAIGLRMGRSPGDISKLRRRFGLPALFGPAGRSTTTEVAA